MLETVTLTKRQEAGMEVAEMKMLGFSLASDKNGQDQECVHQKDRAGGTVWRENMRGRTEVVWTFIGPICTEER